MESFYSIALIFYIYDAYMNCYWNISFTNCFNVDLVESFKLFLTNSVVRFSTFGFFQNMHKKQSISFKKYQTPLLKGDLIILISCGHGFSMLEESEIIEVKQGPYMEEKDKEKFDSISDDKIIMKR